MPPYFNIAEANVVWSKLLARNWDLLLLFFIRKAEKFQGLPFLDSPAAEFERELIFSWFKGDSLISLHHRKRSAAPIEGVLFYDGY